jgi:hypothetical protein
LRSCSAPGFQERALITSTIGLRNGEPASNRSRFTASPDPIGHCPASIKMPDNRITKELYAQKQSNSSSNRYIKLQKLVIMHIYSKPFAHQQLSSMITPRSIEEKLLRSL